MTKRLLTVAALAAATLVVPSSAAASTHCGAIATPLFSGEVNTVVWVDKKGPVSCARARAITRSVYSRNGGTWHCPYGGNTFNDCSHAEGYSTRPELGSWRFWAGPGGGTAWYGRNGRSRVEWYYD